MFRIVSLRTWKSIDFQSTFPNERSIRKNANRPASIMARRTSSPFRQRFIRKFFSRKFNRKTSEIYSVKKMNFFIENIRSSRFSSDFSSTLSPKSILTAVAIQSKIEKAIYHTVRWDSMICHDEKRRFFLFHWFFRKNWNLNESFERFYILTVNDIQRRPGKRKSIDLVRNESHRIILGRRANN